MHHYNARVLERILSRAGLGAILFLLVSSLQGDEQFLLRAEPLDISERGRVTSYVLVLEKSRYSFLPPPGWKVQANKADRSIVLVSADRMASVRVKVVTQNSVAADQSDHNSFRAVVRQRYPAGKITAELVCYSADAKGFAFEVEQMGGHKRPVLTRAVFIPLPGKTIEFEFTTSGEKFGDLRFAFANFLTSFRVGNQKPPKK